MKLQALGSGSIRWALLEHSERVSASYRAKVIVVFAADGKRSAIVSTTTRGQKRYLIATVPKPVRRGRRFLYEDWRAYRHSWNE